MVSTAIFITQLTIVALQSAYQIDYKIDFLCDTSCFWYLQQCWLGRVLQHL